MKTPTELEIERLIHAYDPARAHAYYMRTRKLKGRKRGSSQDPRTGKTRRQIHQDARARQRKELASAIQKLEGKLRKLEQVIREKQHAEASEDRKGKAKKERAAKEKDKPKTAAEKAEIARENEKYRKKNQQKLKTQAKKSGGGSSKGTSTTGASSTQSVTELKSLATKVRGQIAVAKQKLAAL
jgi:hypothetical protein